MVIAIPHQKQKMMNIEEEEEEGKKKASEPWISIVFVPTDEWTISQHTHTHRWWYISYSKGEFGCPFGMLILPWWYFSLKGCYWIPSVNNERWRWCERVQKCETLLFNLLYLVCGEIREMCTLNFKQVHQLQKLLKHLEQWMKEVKDGIDREIERCWKLTRKGKKKREILA